MASKKVLKKNVNAMVFDVVEECFTIQMLDEKKTKKTDKLINEVANFQDDILTKINSAKNKSDFKVIREEVETKAIEYVKELNTLNK